VKAKATFGSLAALQIFEKGVKVSVSFANINQTFSTATKQPKCVEWNSSAKVSTTFDQTANEVISKKRKSFSNTPVSKVSKPAYEVKLTKAQALRAQSNKMKVQAIENKRLEDNVAKNPFEYLLNRQKNDQSAALPMPKKQTVSEIRSTSAANTMGQRNPLTLIKDNVRPASALSKSLVNKSSLSSNFKTTHDKMFKGQKSIADIVKEMIISQLICHVHLNLLNNQDFKQNLPHLSQREHQHQTLLMTKRTLLAMLLTAVVKEQA
jgi:hypothetical protein